MHNATRIAPVYNDDIVKKFTIAALFWGTVGMLVGLIIALQMAFPDLNVEPYFSFGRLRPVHTSGVIFAFGGSVLFATSYFVVQRTCRTRLWNDKLANFTFWGYQAFIVMAALGYVLGVTQGKEYAEPEWYADLWLTVVWVAYLVIFLMTLKNREEPHIYVANWFFLAFIATVAVLHLVNGVSVPVSGMGGKSVPVWGGVQAALIQWWYGHNAVGFFLTAGFLGIMYYFIPKRANRPVYSYRLSILHFWSLIFIYIWAGPHHLHYTALPDWAQTLGMTFSIMLWMPSWGGMINGVMTLSGAWDTLEEIQKDPELYAFAIAGGKTMFKENCSACHGTGAEGRAGYPNLNDDDWIWGGDLQSIYHTLKVGIRSGHEHERASQMPAFGDILKKEGVEQVTTHVLSLSNGRGSSEQGAAIFKQNCASCHGEAGKGGRAFGAPNLADAIWLYGGDRASISQQIRSPRYGVMPSWDARLPDETIKALTIYVHSLGGGEAEKPPE